MDSGNGVDPGALPSQAAAERSITRALVWVALVLPLVVAVLVPLGSLLIAPVTPIAAGVGARRNPPSRPGWGPGWLAYASGAVPVLLNPWLLIPLCAPADLSVLRVSWGVAALVLVLGSAAGGYLGSARWWVLSAVLYAVTFTVVFALGGGWDLEMVC
jgi:hypothetical protein